jgi:ribosomal subunit interface protein
MQTNLHLTFRHLSPSPTLEARVHEGVEHLERFHGRITSCRVVISAPAGHRTKGAPFTVKVDLTVPGHWLCVDTGRIENPRHTDVYAAVHDAFERVKRQLQNRESEQQDARRQAPA